jgi:hypothetical protein
LEILLFSKANAFLFFLKMIVEIFGNAGGCWQGLLNALQTPGARLVLRSPWTNSVPAPRNQATVMLVTTYGLMFGVGAALTGLVLTLEDDS